MSSDQSSRLIAIVDDDNSVQSALQDLIESEGLCALCFGSAEQFLDSRARHDASCLITDIRMPGMSGLELQAKLKSERNLFDVNSRVSRNTMRQTPAPLAAETSLGT